jgi:hypothetical protein
VAIAPTFLKCEIEEHLGRIATDLWVPIARAQQEWEELQAHVYFYQPNPSNDRGVLVVDPDDLPYKNACEELAGTAVYSRDTDFIAMKVPVVTDCLDLTPRAHARAGSVAIGTTLGSSLTLVIGTESLAALYRLVKSILEGFRRLPGLAQIVIAGGVLAMFAHPKSRAKLLDIWWSFCATANAAKDPVLELTAEVANQFFSASATVTQTYKAIQSALPAHRKPSAIMLARTICLISREPLSLAEIERWMRNEGYSTRSRTFAFYLRRVMRASGQFVEVSPGYWTIHALT